MIVLHVGDDTHSQPLAPTNDVIVLTEPSGEADENLVCCLLRVRFTDASSKFIFFASFDPRSWQALALSEGLAARRSVETTLAKRIAELESVEAVQATRIAELEEASANLKLKKGNVTAGYRGLANKYKRLEERENGVELEKTNVAEAHTAQLAEIVEKLVKET
jgi:uncharacterized coiled-coil protein SlyX